MNWWGAERLFPYPCVVTLTASDGPPGETGVVPEASSVTSFQVAAVVHDADSSLNK